MIVPIDSIKPDPTQPRKIFDEEKLQELAHSIKIEGMINAIEVDPQMIILTGERRWRASKLLGLTHVRVNVNETDYPPYERHRRQVAENIHQSSKNGTAMNPIDLAKSFAKLYELKTGNKWIPGVERNFGSSENPIAVAILEISKELGVKVHLFNDYLKLLEEPEFVQRDLVAGRPMTFYKMARRADSEEVKAKLRKDIVAGRFANAKEVASFIYTSRNLPELVQLQSRRKISNEKTNRVISAITRLALALEGVGAETLSPGEQSTVKSQLAWLKGKISKWIENK